MRRNSISSHRNKCVSSMRHFLRTDLYFLANPVQLAVMVVFREMVLREKLFSEADFKAFLLSIGVSLESFRDRILELMQLERFSSSFFSRPKTEEVWKKFQIFSSKGVGSGLIGRGVQVDPVHEEKA